MTIRESVSHPPFQVPFTSRGTESSLPKEKKTMRLDEHVHTLLRNAAARRTIKQGRRVTLGEALYEVLAADEAAAGQPSPPPTPEHGTT